MDTQERKLEKEAVEPVQYNTTQKLGKSVGIHGGRIGNRFLFAQSFDFFLQNRFLTTSCWGHITSSVQLQGTIIGLQAVVIAQK